MMILKEFQKVENKMLIYFFCFYNCNFRIVLCVEFNEMVNIYNKIVIFNVCDEILFLNVYCILYKCI